MIVLSKVRQKQVMQISHRPWAWHWGLTWPEGADRGIHRMGAPREKQPYVHILLVTCQRAYCLNFFFRTKCIFILSANVTPCRATRSFIPYISSFLLLMGWSLEWSFRIVIEVFHLDLHFSILTNVEAKRSERLKGEQLASDSCHIRHHPIVKLLEKHEVGSTLLSGKKISSAWWTPRGKNIPSIRCAPRGHKHLKCPMHPSWA